MIVDTSMCIVLHVEAKNTLPSRKFAVPTTYAFYTEVRRNDAGKKEFTFEMLDKRDRFEYATLLKP
jgi:hypothetical protein